MKAKDICRKTIKGINRIVNFTVLMIIVLLIAFAGYALWDSKQIYQAADKSHYAVYKPTESNEGKSFKELQSINAEVFAWLTVYGTNIDYPVTQGQNNMKYVNTNAEGLYSLSGAIFMDYNNSKNFSDFNSILYGHHMAKKVMFGEIGEFSSKNMFDSHRYGNLFFDERDHGIEFFAFIHADAYDSSIFRPNVKESARQTYLDNLLAKAIHKRDIGIAAEDHIVLLSTCSSSSTNGRDILIGRITEGVFEDPFVNMKANDGKDQADDQNGFVQEIFLLKLMLTLLLIVLILAVYNRFKSRRKRQDI